MRILITEVIIYNCDEVAVMKVVPIYHMIITSSTCSESSLIYKRVRKDSLDPRGTFEACTRPEAVTNNFSNDPNFSRDRAKYIQRRGSCRRDTLHTVVWNRKNEYARATIKLSGHITSRPCSRNNKSTDYRR